MFGGNGIWIYEGEKYLKQYQTGVRPLRLLRFSKRGSSNFDFYKAFDTVEHN